MQHLVGKDQISIEIERAQLRLCHQNYIYLGEQSNNIIVPYGQLHNKFEFITHKNEIPSIGSLEEIRVKEIVFQQIRKYIEQFKQESKQEVLEITKDIILQYSITPAKAHMKFSWQWNNVQSSSKTILTKALEVKMWYVANLPI